MLISEEQMQELKEMVSEVKLTPEQELEQRNQMRQLAIKTLYENQECFVAQWILQNPYANPEHYALKFVYHDESLSGYSVTMEKLPNV